LRRSKSASSGRHSDQTLAVCASAVDKPNCGGIDGSIHVSQEFLLTGHPAKRGRAQSVDRRHAMCRNFATDQQLSSTSPGDRQGFHTTVSGGIAQFHSIDGNFEMTAA
jgi:hypothetical protein